MGRPIGEAGLALIKRFEGCRLKAYKPVATETYWTIGWGHYGSDVKEGQVITQAEADDLLVEDCQRFANAVDNPGNVPLTAQLNANQRDALGRYRPVQQERRQGPGGPPAPPGGGAGAL